MSEHEKTEEKRICVKILDGGKGCEKEAEPGSNYCRDHAPRSSEPPRGKSGGGGGSWITRPVYAPIKD